MTHMISHDIQKRLGENVKQLRKARNLTQFQFAEKAGISEETVKNIELCRCWTSDKNLAKITEALEVDIHRLFLPISTSLDEDSENINQIKNSIAENLRNYIETKLREIL
ncbi:MAG: helix-turn-helix transcriptional regulator [Treponema sp.]|nr:helix-turn-helix transcriptional regulator [Treponema sp.]